MRSVPQSQLVSLPVFLQNPVVVPIVLQLGTIVVVVGGISK